jgi:hypothetical protein
MKYSRRGGTKVMSAVEVVLSSNGCADSIDPLLLSVLVATGKCCQRASCNYDRACLAAIERSNGHGYHISPLLLWPLSTHRKIYDINNKVR